MTNYELVEAMVEQLENNNTVIAMVRFEDGKELDYTMYDEGFFGDVVALGTVSVEAYENNGYDVYGLELTWIDVAALMSL